jgi:hypothetical protein
MLSKLTVNLRMAKPRPKHVVLLDKIEFNCVYTVIKVCVLMHYVNDMTFIILKFVTLQAHMWL